jgi:hypothetical protein
MITLSSPRVTNGIASSGNRAACSDGAAAGHASPVQRRERAPARAAARCAEVQAEIGAGKPGMVVSASEAARGWHMRGSEPYVFTSQLYCYSCIATGGSVSRNRGGP